MLRSGIALGLVALQVLLFSTVALAQTSSTQGTVPVDSTNLWFVILIPAVFAILAVGLGYVILKLTKDSG